MESTKGNVNMHFEKIAIDVDSVGHDLFQEVSNKTGGETGDPQTRKDRITASCLKYASRRHADIHRI
jgi:hypothetical protein